MKPVKGRVGCRLAGREDHGSIGAVDDGRLNELAQRYVLLELAFAKKGEAVAGEHGGAIIRDGLWPAPVMPLAELCPGMEIQLPFELAPIQTVS